MTFGRRIANEVQASFIAKSLLKHGFRSYELVKKMGLEPWYTINFLKNVNTRTQNLVSTKGIN